MTTTIIEQVKEALVSAAAPLEAMIGARTDILHSPDVAVAINKGAIAAREALALLDQLPPPITEAEREEMVEEMETEYQRVLGEKFGYTPKRSGSWFREAMSAALAVIENKKKPGLFVTGDLKVKGGNPDEQL